PDPDRPLLIIWDGCRRYRAAQELGWSTLLCCVRPGVPEDIPRLALQANLNAERWTNAEVTQVVQEFGLERVAPYLSKQTVTKLRGLLSALSEQEFQQYCAMGLGVRGYEEAKRFARVFGWPDEDEEVGKVIRWVMLGGGRSFRSLQLMLEMGAPPRRIAELVSAGKSPRDIF
ncbi:MAG: ParB N-terminal domain-containing protein, partial [Armatimonadota bacterium]|nr:ParB N-terminal domain-containing protein [Armatimonadota bacterium]